MNMWKSESECGSAGFRSLKWGLHIEQFTKAYAENKNISTLSPQINIIKSLSMQSK